MGLEELTSKVLGALRVPKEDSLDTVAAAIGDDDAVLPDDVGAATRMLWLQLAPEWTDFGEDEWHAARAQLPRSEAGNTEARKARAAQIFWDGREELLLTDEELHSQLWSALCEHVSPPWPDADELRAARKAKRKRERKAARAAEKAEARQAAREARAEARGEEGGEEDDDDDDEASEEEASEEASEEGDDASDEGDDEVGVTHERINFDDYLSALSRLDPRKVAPLRSARAFLAMRLDEYGRASIRSLYALGCSLTQLLQTRVRLALLEDERGRLTEQALETFVQESIPKLARLRDHVHLQPGHSFLPFYVAHCVRKLYMLLEPKDKRGVPVEALLLSSELAQFFGLAAELDEDDDAAAVDEGNWFSLAAAIRIYRQFLDLDTDQDGMLTADELSKYGDTLMTLTPAFVGRLFEVVHTYDGRLDYKGYLDFVISCEHRSHPACLAYLFRVLDLDGVGSLGVFEVNYFVRDIVQGLIDSGDEPPELPTIVDEVFDLSKMRKGKLSKSKPGSLERARLASGSLPRITLADLVGCGAGQIVMQCLIDVQGFWNWDNRESLIEYDDEDRYEKDTREAAREVTKLFTGAARAKTPPAVASLVGDDGPDAAAEGELRRLHATRTLVSSLRLAEDRCGDGGGGGSRAVLPASRPASPASRPAAAPQRPATPPAAAAPRPPTAPPRRTRGRRRPRPRPRSRRPDP